MTFRHVLVSLAVTCLCACSSDDTIVSLNVAATDRVPVVERLQVTFKQGSHTYQTDLEPPTETSGDPAVESIKNSFFNRISLPGDWDESDALVSVEAFKKGGASFSPPLVDETHVTIRPEGTVAAYVKLDIPEVLEPQAGGAGGEGGAMNEGGAPSVGGAPSDGGAPGAGGAAAGAAGAG